MSETPITDNYDDELGRYPSYQSLLYICRKFEKDARRYLYLRDKTDAINRWDRTRDGWGGGCGPEYLDNAVDSEMGKEKNE